MSQIHLRVGAGRRERTQARRATTWWVDALVVAVVVTLAYGVIAAASRWVAPYTPTTSVDLSPWRLPEYAGLSTLRMALAYLLSLAFTLVYARVAAAYRSAERVMIPLLDILQSIPILSFMPGVVLGLVALFPHSNLGLEIAAVLLIFTSQAWNMTFSFYHSLRIIPKELREAAAIYRLNVWRRFRLLEAPFAMIPLLWNSMMSWAGGWFFLMAAEQFSLGPRSFELPGLGSYLQTAANAGDLRALLLGLGVLIVVIILLDQLLWRPLVAWADRFKIEQTASGVAPTSWALRLLLRSALVEWAAARLWRPAFAALDRGLSRALARTAPPRMALGATEPEIVKTVPTASARALSAGLWIAVAGVSVLGVIATVRALANVTPGDWGLIGVSALATLARTSVALLIGVAWTVPVGVAIGMRPRLAQRAQPIVQMVASIPATALFPALLLVLLNLPGGLNIAAVALMLLGTQWYVLFNVIAGAMAIPGDLREAGAIYHLRGWRRWRYLILPAIFPYLVTGMITATGGAWNASIVSEYVSFDNVTHSTVGLGAVIAGAAQNSQFTLLLAATLVMAAVVVAVNRLVWRRLYALAEQRFHLD